MNNYDENANNAADRHARLMHQSLSESVPHRSDRLKALFDEVDERPLETKALDEAKQDKADLIKRLLISLVLLTIVIGVLKITGGQ